MSKSIKNIRRGRTCVSLLHVHLVFVAKYRKNIFSKQILLELEKIFASICKDFEANLVEFNGENDHVHLLVNYPPKFSLSSLINSLKEVSSRLIRRKGYVAIQKALWENSLWSPAYPAPKGAGFAGVFLDKNTVFL